MPRQSEDWLAMTDFGEGENLPYIIAYLEADCNFYSRFRQKGRKIVKPNAKSFL